MKGMPGIWNDDEFTTMTCTILGELANCAVNQSPYLYPNNLSRALEEFNDMITKSVPNPTVTKSGSIFKTSYTKLYEIVKKAINASPTIQQWNIPKKGNAQISITSRYGAPYPDYDFIGLDALARNISQNVTLKEKFTNVHHS